jgi:hypothetical protein
VLAVGVALSAGFPAAEADMETKGVLVAARALNFAKPPPPAGAKITVTEGAAKLADVAGALSAFSVVAGNGVGAYAAFVASTAEAKAAGPKVLTIGPLDCVEAGACVLSVETSPKVVIYLSNAAAAAAGVDFDSNFKLMVQAK